MSKVVMNETVLSKKEASLWRVIKAQSAVLYLKGEPGTCKSALFNSIAAKLGMQYIDLRLSQIDESEVGLFPVVNDASRSTDCPFFVHGVPSWAIKANQRPTLIHFEELNRASLPVRNASLQILNERQIGNLKLNENVYMCSTGNLGEADGTDVEEFDRALNGRLFHKKHAYPFTEWANDWANNNLHSTVLGYLTAHPEELYKVNETNPAYASHRSWTNLSKYLKVNAEENAPASFILSLLHEDGSGFVGSSVTKMLRWVEENSMISIEDVLNRWEEVASTVKGMNRGRVSELLNALKATKTCDMNEAKIANLIEFIKSVHIDERMAYLIHVLDKEVTTGDKSEMSPLTRAFLRAFKPEIQKTMAAADGKNATTPATPETPAAPEAIEKPKRGRPKKSV
jgi:hypothetical protein